MRKKKILGIPANKKQFKDFEKCINHPFFVKRQLAQQWTDGKYDFKILNFNEDQTCWFCVLDKQYFLYNETTKELKYYGTLFDPEHPVLIQSSNDIPWEDIKGSVNLNKKEK